MAQDSHFENETYNASELRNAMRYFNIGGRDAIEPIDGIDDFRGDGLDGNGHPTAGRPASQVGGMADMLKRNNCLCHCGEAWLCNRKPNPICNCGLKGDEFYPESDGLDADLLALGLDATDDTPSVLALDYFGGDETAAGEFAESMLAADSMSEDDLIAMGWDPFKAIKKAVRPLTKTVSKAIKTVKKTAGGALKTVGSVAKAGFKLNPYSLLKDPKGALRAQLEAAKSIVGQVKTTTNLAKDLVKSPIVKTVVGGAAIVFPPIGVPAAAALATAAAVAKGVDSPIFKVADAARKVVQNTARLAQGGDSGAQKALSLIATNKKALVADRLTKPPRGARRMVFDIGRNGRISQFRI